MTFPMKSGPTTKNHYYNYNVVIRGKARKLLIQYMLNNYPSLYQSRFVQHNLLPFKASIFILPQTPRHTTRAGGSSFRRQLDISHTGSHNNASTQATGDGGGADSIT